MLDPQWHDLLMNELRKRGVPSSVSARLTEELRDHWSDLLEECAMSDSKSDSTTIARRLGSPELLGERLAAEWQSRPRRWTWFAFTIGPVFAAICFLIAFLFAFCGAAYLSGIGGQLDSLAPEEPVPERVLAWVRGLAFGCRFVPFAGAALFFCFLATRRHLANRWPIVAGCVLTLLAASFQVVVEMNALGHGTFSFGLGIGQAQQFLQALGPASIVAAWLFAARRTTNFAAA